MCSSAENPTLTSLLAELKQCSRERDLSRGKRLHLQAINTGFIPNSYVLSSLINMYSKCGSLADAKLLFDRSFQKTVASWNCLMWGYIDNGENELALRLFHSMGATRPNDRTFVAALIACGSLGAQGRGENSGETFRWLEAGRALHIQALNSSSCDLFVENTLIDMYMKCGSSLEARSVFSGMKKRDVVSWTALLQGYFDNGDHELVLELFWGMFHEASPDAKTYVVVLTACRNLAREARNWSRVAGAARMIRSRALENGKSDVFVETSLISVFARCRDMASAREVFDNMAVRNEVSWTALMQGYIENGESELGFSTFLEMERSSGCSPNSRTYTAALVACGASAMKAHSNNNSEIWVENGEVVYDRALKKQCWSTSLDSALLKMYSSCGRMQRAQEVFDRMLELDVVNWTCLIRGYVDAGKSEVALELFSRMNPVAPDSKAYLVAFAACTTLIKSTSNISRKWLQVAKQIHSRAAATGCCDMFVETTLVDLYSKAGEIVVAQAIFDAMERKTVASWNAVLHGYVENGENELALELFEGMGSGDDEAPDARSFVAAVIACASLASKQQANTSIWVGKGKRLHSRAIQSRCCDRFLESALVDMYSKCGRMELAQEVFIKISSPDVISCNCLIQGYVNNGRNKKAMELFQRMKTSGVEPNASSYVCAIQACGNLMEIDTGRMLHAEIRSRGLQTDAVVGTSLVDFYGSCGEMQVAREVFDSIPVKDVSLWNSLMCGFGRQGNAEEVLNILLEMRKHGVSPDSVTLTHALSACSHAGFTEKGKELFDSMEAKFGVKPEIIHYNCMIDLLRRGNFMDEALNVVKATMS